MVVLNRQSPINEFVFKNGTQLYEHQKRELLQMKHMENPSYIVEESIITTRFGVLGSPSGSGKTSSILGLIESTYMNGVVRNNAITYGCHVATITAANNDIENITFSETTLIIVPVYLICQWEDSLTFRNIKFTKGDKAINNQPVHLLPGSKFNTFFLANRHICFKRIVIDEADTIKIPLERYIHNQFIWFVTSNPVSLYSMYKFKRYRPLYRRYFSAFNNIWMNQNFFLVVTDQDVIDSDIFGLYQQVKNRIKCKNSNDKQLRMTTKVRQYINEEKYDEAIISMSYDYVKGCDISTNLENTTMNTSRVNIIKTMLNNIQNETCVICFEVINDKNIYNISKCCGNLYCSKCVCRFSKSYYTICPMCRYGFDIFIVENINNDTLCALINENSKLQTKEFELTNLIKNTNNGKFLVFDIWASDFKKITQILCDEQIEGRVLCGHADKVADKQRQNTITVLFANEYHHAPGLNMPWVTDLVFMTRHSIFMEKYFVHKCLSNRKTTASKLNIHYMFAENE